MTTTRRIGSLLTITLCVLAFASSTRMARADKEGLSKEVLARLPLTGETQGKVDSVFAKHASKIADAQKAVKTALDEQGNAMFGGFATVMSNPKDDAAHKKWKEDCDRTKEAAEEASKRLENAVLERDDAIHEVLPPELAGKFARGMRLVHERDDAFLKVFADSVKNGLEEGVTDAQRAKNAENGQKEISDISDTFAKKLDEQIGKIQK